MKRILFVLAVLFFSWGCDDPVSSVPGGNVVVPEDATPEVVVKDTFLVLVIFLNNERPNAWVSPFWRLQRRHLADVTGEESFYLAVPNNFSGTVITNNISQEYLDTAYVGLYDTVSQSYLTLEYSTRYSDTFYVHL